MKDENLATEIAKRRSSILKTNMNRENGDTSPVLARRVSFAENLKVKTFDETGCNTSELVPHPVDMSGTCDMSVVNTMMSCENMSVEMEISQESSEVHIQISAKTVAAVVAESESMDVDEEDEDVTDDILNQIGPKDATDIKTPGSTTSDDEFDSDEEGNKSGDNSELTEKILRRLTVTGSNVTGTTASTTDTGTTMLMKNGVDASMMNESKPIQFNAEIRKKMEDLEKRRQKWDEQAKWFTESTEDFVKRAKEIRAELKKMPARHWMKK